MKTLFFTTTLRALGVAAALGLHSAVLGAETPAEPKRPRILGVSHAAFFIHDIAKSRAFYKDFLGFDEPYSLPNKDGTGLYLTWIKINDLQTIELFTETEPNSDRLHQIAFITDDADGMRRYLASKGLKVPEKRAVGRSGNANFTLKDPDGHTVEIVQYLPESWTTKDNGKHLPATRVAARMNHIGFMVADLEAAKKFYGDILGFKETWRGSSNGTVLNWVNMKVPDGEDYVEFMLYGSQPTTDRVRTMNHVCLEVPDVAKVEQTLKGRTPPAECKQMTPLKAGINRKRQINTFDPDGTRVEIMEPGTIDGTPTPSSEARPPKRA